MAATIDELRDRIAMVRSHVMTTCEPSRAAQVVNEKLHEAEMWLGKCRPRAIEAMADPNETTPHEGVGKRRSGQWPKVGEDE